MSAATEIAEAVHSVADSMFDSNTDQNRVARALWGVFQSPDESDRNFEPANVVDGLFAIARSIGDLADAIRESREPVEQPAAPPVVGWNGASRTVNTGRTGYPRSSQ